MRHKKKGRKLGRKVGNRRALLMNLACQLIVHKKIKTTDPKAKELRSYIEPLITLAKKNSLHSRRLVIKKIPKKNIVRILFEEIAPRFTDRDGGYTRIMRLAKPRLGDAGVRAILEFVGENDRVKVKEATKPAFADDEADAVEETTSEATTSDETGAEDTDNEDKAEA
jgi:large subunit ribosomal protein L17